MIFKKGECRRKLPPHSQVYHAYCEEDSNFHALAHVTYLSIKKQREHPNATRGQTGLPVWFAVEDGWIELWPTPDRKYNIRIRYTPPMKEC
jgi:hypothetical protein